MRRKIQFIHRLLFEFFLGGTLYAALEIAWRGFSHISMFFAGGICFLLLGRLGQTRVSYIPKCILGGLTITSVEFLVGVVVNVWLKLNVWSYANYKFNLLGQVCPLFLILWCALSGMVFFGYKYLMSAVQRPFHLCLLNPRKKSPRPFENLYQAGKKTKEKA